MREEQLVFALKNELTQHAPDVWDGIRQKIAGQIATALLQELDRPPSPQGRLFGEIRDTAKPNILKCGA